MALPLHRIYVDKSRSYHSPDPSDPSVTERVITIMLGRKVLTNAAMDGWGWIGLGALDSPFDAGKHAVLDAPRNAACAV